MAEPEPLPGEDRLLDGRVRLLQPEAGYRVAIDTVFLAAAVPAAPGDLVLELGAGGGAAALCLAWREPGDLVLELGAGGGAAALCLAWREPGCRVIGIERDRGFARLAQRNIELNGVVGRVDVMVGDLLRPPPRLAPGSFNHVMANPPHLAPEAASASPNALKASATVEGEAAVEDWIKAARTMLRPKGSLTLVHRADRLDAILAALHGRMGEIVVFPLWPGGSRAAQRVLVRARKGIATPTRLAPGLVLHEPDGRFTAAADAILREGAGLVL